MSLAMLEQFGRVAVLMGGDGTEREVSLAGGKAICDALCAQQVNAVTVDGMGALVEGVHSGQIDRVFNLIHGKGGEDGVVQGLLSAINIPYTGTGVLGAALSMDKGRSKQIWQKQKLNTADFVVVNQLEQAVYEAQALGYPLVVKPVAEGSSYGVSMVKDAATLPAAFEHAAEFGNGVMLESFVAGYEYAVAILNGSALPVVRIEPDREFYDYQAKYEDDKTGYFCPSDLSPQNEAELQETALKAFDALGCTGWGRVDFMGQAEGPFFLLEANTTPGMTSHSLVPKAASAIGMNFESLVVEILKTSLQRDDS